MYLYKVAASSAAAISVEMNLDVKEQSLKNLRYLDIRTKWKSPPQKKHNLTEL